MGTREYAAQGVTVWKGWGEIGATQYIEPLVLFQAFCLELYETSYTVYHLGMHAILLCVFGDRPL